MKSKLVSLLTGVSFALAGLSLVLAATGCSGNGGSGGRTSRLGPGEGDGVVFEGGDPVLGHAEVALDFFALGLTRAAAGDLEGACETPATNMVAASVRAILESLTTTQRAACRRDLAALAAGWSASLLAHRPAISLRVGPLTILPPGATTSTQVSAKTVAAWGNEILLDIEKARYLSLTELSELLGHETGHQHTGLSDWSTVADFRDGRHYLDVLTSAATALGFRQAPARSLALVALNATAFALLGLSQDGELSYRLLDPEAVPTSDWYMAGAERGLRQVLATTSAAGKAVAFTLGATYRTSFLVARDGIPPFDGTWQLLPEQPLRQLAAGRLADGRLVVAGIDDTPAKNVYVILEEAADTFRFPAAWTRTGLAGVRRLAVERMGDGNLWFYGQGAPLGAVDLKWTYLHAKDATLAHPAALRWIALPGAGPAPAGDEVLDPADSSPRLIPLGGAGRQLMLSHNDRFVRYTWDGNASFAPGSVPRAIEPETLLFPLDLWSVAATKGDDGRLLVAQMRLDGTLVGGRERATDPLDFRGRWRTLGFNQEIAERFRPLLSGSIHFTRCKIRPFLEGAHEYFELTSRELITRMRAWNRKVCENAIQATFPWWFGADATVLDGTFRETLRGGAPQCRITVLRCQNHRYANGTTVTLAGSAYPAKLAACFALGFIRWRECGSSRLDRIVLFNRDGTHATQVDFGGDHREVPGEIEE